MPKTYQKLLQAHKYEVQEFTKAPFTYIWVNSIKFLIPNIKAIVLLPRYIYENPTKALYDGVGIAMAILASIVTPTSLILRAIVVYSSVDIFINATNSIAKNNLIKDTTKFINLPNNVHHVNDGENTTLDNATTFQINVLEKMNLAIRIPIYLALIGFGLGNLPMLNLLSGYIFANTILAKAQEMGDEKAIGNNEPKRGPAPPPPPVPLHNFCMNDNWSTSVTRSAGTSAIELMN